MLLAGCDTLGEMQEEDPTTAGARLLNLNYEQIDLITLLDPEGRAKNGYAPLLGEPPTWEQVPIGRQIDLAFSAYHKREVELETKEPERRSHRDQIQERLLGASNDMCYRYKRYMQNTQSDGNFWLGTLTTIAGAAGALVTGGGSQILAGTASALSGIRAEFNQDYFQNVTVATIWKGIEFRRERAFNTIAIEGQDKDTDVYPVEAAVKDAIAYHAECSMVAGIEELGDTVQLAKDPGLDAVSRTLLKLNIARNIAESKSTDPADLLGDAAPGSPSAALLQYGTPRGDGRRGSGGDPMAVLAGYLQEAAKTTTENTKLLAGMAHWPKVADDSPSSRQTIGSKVGARTKLAMTQLTACQAAASTASIDIAKAEGAVAIATTPAEQAKAVGELAAKKSIGDAVVSQLSIALSWLKADMDGTIGVLQQKNLDLVKTDKPMLEDDIAVVAKSLDASVTDPDKKKLPCAAP